MEQQNERRQKLLDEVRQKLPDERRGETHHFTVTDAEGQTTDGYLTVGLYPDGRVGEIGIKIAKAPHPLGMVLDQWARLFSLCLQCGFSLEELCTRVVGVWGEPYGYTGSKDVPRCTSVLDYVARWLKQRYCK